MLVENGHTQAIPRSYKNPDDIQAEDLDPRMLAMVKTAPSVCPKCESDFEEVINQREAFIITNDAFPYTMHLLVCKAKDIHNCNCEYCTEPRNCHTVMAWCVTSPTGDLIAQGRPQYGRPPSIEKLAADGVIPPLATWQELPLDVA